ncbi:hypothetical protein F503_04346 [Ophiostoma piceae UAMH 11346]|uniref:Rna polymerase i-specific transcription initiation factor rrn6-like protein n=1 Tax=Ophiostoma piceae (strain UAMH 11346) TaxID=1262450 RepID=S3C5I7_OPHP1|nr:hypothetical protein F503_04346 [Ophiostoma piceae UAMH 11346]
MAERGRPSPRRKDRTGVVTLVHDHRTNDSVLGHVGRLTYISPQDAGTAQHLDAHKRASIGTLLTNRETGKLHSWRQVQSFQRWHSPLTSDVPGSNVESSVAPRPYIAWLLKGAPEALEGIAGPPYNEVIEDMRDAELLRKPQARLPLLAHGEISDIRVGERKSCQVLAMATGESGHALRIVRVTPQDWAWAASGNISLELNNIDVQDEGYWCGNALAINQIKFVVDNPAKPMSWWLIVQTSAETLLFEPTLGRTLALEDAPCPDIDSQGPSFISMDLKIRIPMNETGGRMHCDMAFNPATSKRPPQLAIVDDGGNWSVWNIIGDRHMRKTILSTVLHAQGNLAEGLDPSPYVATTHGLGHLNRIVWLPLASSGSGQAESSKPLHQNNDASIKAEASAAHEEEQSMTLLLGNATAVNIVNIDHGKKPVLTLNTVHSGSLDAIVDVQISPHNPAHIFVLTTVALFWFDLSKVSHHFNPKPVPGAPRAKQAQPLLLLSCPHLRNPTDRTIKLCLVSGAAGAVTALIYSIKQPEAVVFRFPDAASGQEPTYEQQVIRFDYAQEEHSSNHHDTETLGRYRGQQTILVLPRQPRINAMSKLSAENFGHEYIEDGVNFFQVISLRPDLSLQWALYSCSPPHASRPVAALFPKTKMTKKKSRRGPKTKQDEVASYFANRFVVPDGFEDEMVPEKPMLSNALPAPLPVPDFRRGEKAALTASDTEASEAQPAPKKKVEVYNMARLFNLLDARLEEVAVEAFESTDAPRSFQNPSPLDMIRQIIEVAAKHGSFAYTTLLNISNSNYLKEYGADLTDLSWTRQLFELGTIEERRVTIFDQLRGESMRHQVCNKGLFTLYEVMGKLCAISLARDDRERYSDDPFVRRQGLLAYMAIKLYFSQISMVVMPRQVVYNASARTTPALEDAQSTLPTPFSAAEQRHFGDTVLSSSPTKPSVPSWLLSSSQDYGVQGPESPRHGGHIGGGDEEYVLPSREIDDLHDGADVETPRHENGNDVEEEDPVIGRLRQFAKSIKSEPPRADGELRLLTHWELGSDPADFNWVPLGAAGEAEEELRRQAQEARDKKQRKLEKRAMRDRERLLSMGVGMGASGSASYLPTSSQPMSSQLPSQLPNHFHNQTLASPGIMSSQVFSSQVVPASQPVIHTGTSFSQRPKKKKRKPATARGFK